MLHLTQRHVPLTAALAFAALAAIAVRGAHIQGAQAQSMPRLRLRLLATIDDAKYPELAKPYGIWVDRRSRFVVADNSDKDIKIYTANGRRSATVGGPGTGLGQFKALSAAQPYRDSIVALDAATHSLTVFAPSGVAARTLVLPPPRVFDIRIVDDSLFLLIASPIGADNQPLVRLVRPSGEVVAQMFDRHSYLEHRPALIQWSSVMADARNGRVVVAMVGSDSIFAFDYRGQPTCATMVDPAEPLPILARLLSASHDQVSTSDGHNVMDQMRAVTSLVIGNRGMVATQVLRLDPIHGIDIYKGGEVVLSDMRGNGCRMVSRQALPAALLGRQVNGLPLLIGYGDSPRSFVISALEYDGSSR